MSPGRILLVLTCLLSASWSAGDQRHDTTAARTRASNGARLFGAYSTVLRTSIITSTTATDFYTCAKLISTQFGCTGRRRRRHINRRELLQSEEAEASMEPALLPTLASSRQPDQTPADKEKVLLTIFTTSTTTVTYSTLTINSATTVSVTYYCTTSGMSTFPAC